MNEININCHRSKRCIRTISWKQEENTETIQIHEVMNLMVFTIVEIFVHVETVDFEAVLLFVWSIIYQSTKTYFCEP